jgi:UDP-GlcNAc:undecaprenyl-phosphate/decaprenyl-phosphate GlcNAc-1-phosphate transferase
MNVEIVALALGASLLLTPPLSAFLRRAGVIDHPNYRSSHSAPVVRAGGVAPAIAASLALLSAPGTTASQQMLLLLAAAGFAEIGLADDFLGIRASYRFLWQALFAAAVLPSLIDGMGLSGAQILAVGCALLVWQVGFVNAFNFMDGINGISVAQTLVAGGTWMVVGYVEGIGILVTGGAVIAAAALGFAPFNFPRASVFLGDVGSYFLGAWLATLFVLGIAEGAPVVPMAAPLFVYMADTSVTLLKRIRGGETWYAAHKDHVYQQLNQSGWSHCRTTLVATCFMTACSGVGCLALVKSDGTSVWAALAVAAVGLLYVNSPRILRLRTNA